MNRGFHASSKIGAFTLIELISVIAILSIIAAFILPKFNQTQQTAIRRQEDAIITALKEAINHRHMQNVLGGNDVWPGSAGDPLSNGNPYTLLNPAPPSKVHNGAVGNQDNVSWRYFDCGPSADEYYIFCPHYDGSIWGANWTTGRFYFYSYGDNMYASHIALGLKKGGMIFYGYGDIGHSQ